MPVIVNVGALVGHKGQKYLIDAMPLVLREVPDAHLIIFGEGELRAPLEKQIKQLSLGKRVLLPGFREDVMSLMKSADLFVMCSVTEGLGSAVLDAMAMGHAVVGTRAGGIPEAVVPGRDRIAGRARRCEGARGGDRAAAEGRDLRKQFGEAGRAARRRALRRRSTGRGNARSLPARRRALIISSTDYTDYTD